MSTSAGNGSPASLIAEARAGSPHALSALYLEHGAALFRLAYRLVGAREDAEDVVHEMFVGLPDALQRYEERGSFAAWLKRVTARMALMRLRSRKRRREVSLDDAAGQAEPPRASERDGLQAAVNTLPDHLRAVLVLKGPIRATRSARRRQRRYRGPRRAVRLLEGRGARGEGGR